MVGHIKKSGLDVPVRRSKKTNIANYNRDRDRTKKNYNEVMKLAFFFHVRDEVI